MNILVDGYNIGMPRATGVGTYGHAFAQSARRLGHQVELLLGRDDLGDAPRSMGRIGNGSRKIRDFLQAPFGFDVMSVDHRPLGAFQNMPPVDRLWNRGRLFRAAKGAYRRTGLFTAVRMPHIDIAHWTYPLPLYVPGAKNIYTIHDLVPLTHPDMVRDDGGYRRLCVDIARRADHILTVSEASRSDILRHLPVSVADVTNTYQAIPTTETDAGDDDRILYRHSLTREGYFLFFGAIEPKKNLLRLLHGFEGSGVTTPLVVAGKLGWNWEKEVAELKRLTAAGGARRLLWLDYLPRPELFSLIRNAKAVLFPSLVEGFGLPALEAMMQGVPLMISDIPALREVSGGHALTVDPLSIEAISRGLQTLDGDVELRRDLAMRGGKRAAFFSTQRYDANLAMLLRELL